TGAGADAAARWSTAHAPRGGDGAAEAADWSRDATAQSGGGGGELTAVLLDAAHGGAPPPPPAGDRGAADGTAYERGVRGLIAARLAAAETTADGAAAAAAAADRQSGAEPLADLSATFARLTGGALPLATAGTSTPVLGGGGGGSGGG